MEWSTVAIDNCALDIWSDELNNPWEQGQEFVEVGLTDRGA